MPKVPLTTANLAQCFTRLFFNFTLTSKAGKNYNYMFGEWQNFGLAAKISVNQNTSHTFSCCN